MIKLLCSQFYSYQILLHLGGAGGLGFTHDVPSLNSKTFHFVFFPITVAVSTHLLAVCRHFICPMSLFHGHASVVVWQSSLIFMYLMFCSVPRVRKLLKAGVNVNASDGATSDNKALHWAVSYGNADIVKLLCGRFIFYIFWNVLSPYLKLVLV